jgi:hypothetical protein
VPDLNQYPQPTGISKPVPDVHSEAILSYLTTWQHLRPHLAIAQILDQTTQEFGCCPQAITRALQWLRIDGSQAIGRLRRSELVQLARAVHRFWMQNLASEVSEATR